MQDDGKTEIPHHQLTLGDAANVDFSGNSLVGISGQDVRFTMHDNAKMDLTGGVNRPNAGPEVIAHGNAKIYIQDGFYYYDSKNKTIPENYIEIGGSQLIFTITRRCTSAQKAIYEDQSIWSQPGAINEFFNIGKDSHPYPYASEVELLSAMYIDGTKDYRQQLKKQALNVDKNIVGHYTIGDRPWLMVTTQNSNFEYNIENFFNQTETLVHYTGKTQISSYSSDFKVTVVFVNNAPIYLKPKDGSVTYYPNRVFRNKSEEYNNQQGPLVALKDSPKVVIEDAAELFMGETSTLLMQNNSEMIMDGQGCKLHVHNDFIGILNYGQLLFNEPSIKEYDTNGRLSVPQFIMDGGRIHISDGSDSPIKYNIGTRNDTDKPATLLVYGHSRLSTHDYSIISTYDSSHFEMCGTSDITMHDNSRIYMSDYAMISMDGIKGQLSPAIWMN